MDKGLEGEVSFRGEVRCILDRTYSKEIYSAVGRFSLRSLRKDHNYAIDLLSPLHNEDDTSYSSFLFEKRDSKIIMPASPDPENPSNQIIVPIRLTEDARLVITPRNIIY